MELCPCCSEKKYIDCCFPIIKGERKAQTAEELMRSRYSAHAKHEIDYILNSTHPDKRNNFNIKSSQEWSLKSEWLGLEIKNTIDGNISDMEGYVEFIAKFKYKDLPQTLHEKSFFKKDNDTWFYFDGKPVPAKQVSNASKIGRNEPCPCGSGKKFKKCCGP